jgi:hypothetical protein
VLASAFSRARRPIARTLLSVATLLLLTGAARTASAQLEPLEEGIAVGEWTFYPSFALRLRGEYRRNPVDVGGDVYERTAVQSDGFQSAVPPIVRRDAAVKDQWLVAERARLGIGVEWEVISGKLVLQDARVWGVVPGAADDAADGGVASFGPYEAYLDVRTDVDDPTLRVRVGRQAVAWGDGRLIGDNDWSPRGSYFDAAKLELRLWEIELQGMAAMLAFPGALPADAASHERQLAVDDSGAPTNREGTGAQLYGLDARWRVVDLFGVELTGLARIARDPLPAELTRGDTYVIDGRLFGDYRGVSYAVEGAYQLGRVSGFGILRDINAFALAGRVSWLTALPGNFRFAARGGYASGDDSDGQGEELGRFDPIAPEVHGQHGQMDLSAWSNNIHGGGDVSVRPLDELLIEVGYSFQGLAEPGDRWSTGSLIPVGADPTNESRVLGHEVDARLGLEPWPYLRFGAAYGIFILGDGGKNVLASSGRRDAALLHWGMLQAELRAP